jgi:cellobiose dehydrogenase (acceptor)
VAQNATFAFILPPGHKGDEFIGQWIIPVENKWAGMSLGGKMIDAPLVMAWPNNGTVVHSTRFATAYAYPPLYQGPRITTLPHTHENATHWTWTFHCKNCTSKSSMRVWVDHRRAHFEWSGWSTGALNQTATAPIGIALSTNAVTTPSNPNSTFTPHTFHGIGNLSLAHAHSLEYFLLFV